MSILQILLFPFAVVYQWITSFRNWLYENGYKQHVSFPLPVISVGNLTVGGTGKTPHVEYLIRLLKDHKQLATLSRGYGRQTTGFIIADKQASAATIGDEPMQFYQKFSSQIKVTVGEKRVPAVEQLLRKYPQIELILLDDAFQHRAIKPAYSILLSDYHRPFYKDFVLPAGRLRESRQGAKRADVIIVSKCPADIRTAERETIITQIRKYSQTETPVYFTSIDYGQPVPYHPSAVFNAKVLLVSGLANSAPLEQYVRSHYQLVHHLDFNDHHTYTRQDIVHMQKNLEQYGADVILTTEKDYVKLMQAPFADLVEPLPFYFLPIEVRFLFGEEDAFYKNLWQAITHKKTNY
ncbi:tetraacyldisaccharide 4'-kinase [Rhodocytophaga aerolata]|uniref:Tetraacyldisaccharide 4'-kinase n=1 Tax=Rhodocytophaga aerolata TaxID=455078 RepID=A0ABT8QZ39_9BACT|nr:tetraacyldisaccharide 4'-kinase [Rhodocytophaga aerolata]MDO1445110.1 tetraacyldisaccharide 4'-kinase [Rhodocytophaga aerolata]